jgi:outer membrane receptor protein involved in Fe transport
MHSTKRTRQKMARRQGARLGRLLLMGLAPAVPATAQEAPAAGVTELPELVVRSRRFEEARGRIAPALGATTYEIDRATIEALPSGANAGLNQVLLQAPGVVQEAQGDLHVRGDHRNLQYRINGVTVPEAISGFGQLFDARGLSAVSLITGALPAQFGYRTAGIVDLRLRSGAQDPGGSIGLYGGSFGTFQPSLSYGGAIGGLEYYFTGSYLRSDRAFENPTPDRVALHNETRQARGLINLGYALDDTTRLAFIAGTNQSRYEIPNTRGIAAEYEVPGLGPFDSANLRARQWQRTSFAVAAVQHTREAFDAQISAFVRQTSISYQPDAVGDLLGSGVASRTIRRNLSVGTQADASYRLGEAHVLRGGFFVSSDVTRAALDSTVLPLDADGAVGGAPFVIAERGRIRTSLYGVYLQDEWRITDALTLNYGARFDVSQGPADGQQLSPRVNLVWRPTGSTTVALGYARYFTPPPAELLTAPALARYVGTTLEPEVSRASPVVPERSHYFNAGIRQRIGEELTLGLEAYYRTVRDMQDLGQFGRAYVFSPYNYEEGRVYGAELSATWRRDPLLLYANLTYGRSEGRGIRSNQYFFGAEELAYINRKFVRTDHEQTFTGSAGASWRAWEGGTLSATLVYGSGMRRGFANSESVTPYLTANLGVSQTLTLPDGGAWTARLDVINAFDRVYQLRDGTGIGVGAPQYGARRGFFVGLSRAL